MNRLKKSLNKSVEQKYLFILSPPYSGSTLLHEVLSTSAMISPNNIFDTREGQQLPELRDKMFVKGRFETSFEVDWTSTVSVWHKYWDPSLPILLDKSPANIVRAAEIEKHCDPIYFLVLVRNPYAVCESMIRMNDWNTERAANFAIKCLNHQKENLEHLQHTTLLTYEQMTDDVNEINKAVQQLLPEIKDLDADKKFKAHNFKKERLRPTNLNSQKLVALGAPKIKELNQVFQKHADLLTYFGYDIL